MSDTRLLDQIDLEQIDKTNLSRSGNLCHPLVKLEAMSWEQAEGEGLQILYGVHDSPFGQCLIATTTKGICNLHFADAMDEITAIQYLRTDWTKAEILCDRQGTEAIRDRIFQPAIAPTVALNVHVQGTNFQIQVWRELLRVPFGNRVSYQALARSLGRPTAARAVGHAVGRNPVGYIIPCHRVVRASGAMGGYRWGLERKAALLAWEARLYPNN